MYILESEFEENQIEKRINFLKYPIPTRNLWPKLGDSAVKLEKLSPSSAAPERMLGTIGFSRSDLRNGLEIKKLEKLTFIKRMFIDNL